MIFGSVKLNKTIQFKNRLVENISHQLSWPDVQSKKIKSESFWGFYFYDKRLPQPKLENYFYKDEEKGIFILLDGAIYNESEVRIKLNLPAHRFSNLELISKAYEKWGITFAERFNGDFVIVIYSNQSNQVILINDHMGIRPVAFAVIDSLLYFGTDVTGLCKALFSDEKIDKQFLLNIFLQEGYSYSLLPHKKLIKVNPGHYVKISSGKQEYNKYWHPEKIKIDKTLSFTKVTEDLRILLNDAVAIRADKNYTASAHVSGGLDSGMVAVLARKLFKEQPLFYGFSWSPEIDTPPEMINKDERLLVRKICQQNDITPVFTNFNEDDYLAFLSNWRHPSEYIYERKTLEAARDKNINLIFSGWGGDEFLSIGEVCIDSDLLREIDWDIFLKKYPIKHFRKFVSALFYKGLFPSIRQSHLKYKTFHAIYPYIRQNLKNNLIPRKDRFSSISRRKFQLQMIEKFALAARTTDWYVHGQRNGIEYRYPLLDKRIVEYMLKVPSHCLVKGNNNRIILRTIGKDCLPDEIVNGTKNDPVNFYQFDVVVKNVERQLINEYKVFLRNSELDFIDFTMLEAKVRENGMHGSHKNDDLLILHYLKKAHEFTKGYYSKRDST